MKTDDRQPLKEQITVLDHTVRALQTECTGIDVQLQANLDQESIVLLTKRKKRLVLRVTPLIQKLAELRRIEQVVLSRNNHRINRAKPGSDLISETHCVQLLVMVLDEHRRVQTEIDATPAPIPQHLFMRRQDMEERAPFYEGILRKYGWSNDRIIGLNPIDLDDTVVTRLTTKQQPVIIDPDRRAKELLEKGLAAFNRAENPMEKGKNRTYSPPKTKEQKDAERRAKAAAKENNKKGKKAKVEGKKKGKGRAKQAA